MLGGFDPEWLFNGTRYMHDSPMPQFVLGIAWSEWLRRKFGSVW